MDKHNFLKYLPQRPPFLFIDRVVEQSENQIVAEKDVRSEEPFFEGHFPGKPVMPAVLICEFVFQAGAILMAVLDGGFGDRLPMLTRVQNVRIKNSAVPGDTLSAEVTLKEKLSNAYYLKAQVTTNSKKIMILEFAGMLSGNEK
tara:strand:+ start:1900 stop:2331 length:432 start_codon:yes stop_codon:yes gene_type:complete